MDSLGKPQNKGSFLVVGPLRGGGEVKDRTTKKKKTFEARKNVTVKLERVGG